MLLIRYAHGIDLCLNFMVENGQVQPKYLYSLKARHMNKQTDTKINRHNLVYGSFAETENLTQTFCVENLVTY